MIVDPKGYILTNRHVVEKADRIRVRFQDDPAGVQHDAKVIGTDQETESRSETTRQGSDPRVRDIRSD